MQWPRDSVDLGSSAASGANEINGSIAGKVFCNPFSSDKRLMAAMTASTSATSAQSTSWTKRRRSWARKTTPRPAGGRLAADHAEASVRLG